MTSSNDYREGGQQHTAAVAAVIIIELFPTDIITIFCQLWIKLMNIIWVYLSLHPCVLDDAIILSFVCFGCKCGFLLHDQFSFKSLFLNMHLYTLWIRSGYMDIYIDLWVNKSLFMHFEVFLKLYMCQLNGVLLCNTYSICVYLFMFANTCVFELLLELSSTEVSRTRMCSESEFVFEYEFNCSCQFN